MKTIQDAINDFKAVDTLMSQAYAQQFAAQEEYNTAVSAKAAADQNVRTVEASRNDCLDAANAAKRTPVTAP